VLLLLIQCMHGVDSTARVRVMVRLICVRIMRGMVKTATNQKGEKSKRQQKFIANNKTVIEHLVTESTVNK